jgi:hypothetical protein
LVAHNRTGMIIKTHSPAALAEAATLIFTKRGLLDVWSRAAAATALETLDSRALSARAREVVVSNH